MSIPENVQAVLAQVRQAALEAGRSPEAVTLCAATKTQTDEAIRQAIAAGVTVCGENRVQELTAHLEAGAYAGAQVHFIGHLQTNKVKQVVGHVDLIHSVDSERLLRAIDAQAGKLGLCQDILLEVNIGEEEAKSGFAPAELLSGAEAALGREHITVLGLMTIPPADAEREENLRYFDKVRALFLDMNEKLFHNRLQVLSMGMSGDYEDAVRAGATMVRVGTAIFGSRHYT